MANTTTAARPPQNAIIMKVIQIQSAASQPFIMASSPPRAIRYTVRSERIRAEGPDSGRTRRLHCKLAVQRRLAVQPDLRESRRARATWCTAHRSPSGRARPARSLAPARPFLYLGCCCRGGGIRTAVLPFPKPESARVNYLRKESLLLVRANIASNMYVWIPSRSVGSATSVLPRTDKRFRVKEGTRRLERPPLSNPELIE